MGTHLPLTELARVLHQHLTCPAPLQKQDQTEVKLWEIEQALASPETTIFICGESRRLPQMPVINGTCLCDRPGETDFLVVDEFDDVTTEEEQKRFANFVQQLAEQRTPLHFVLCGVSESVRELLKAHESSYDFASYDQNLQANVSAYISSTRDRAFDTGAPHHVYVLSEKLFWEMFNDPTFARSIR